MRGTRAHEIVSYFNHTIICHENYLIHYCWDTFRTCLNLNKLIWLLWTSLFCSNVLDLLVGMVLDLLSCYVPLAYLFMLDFFLFVFYCDPWMGFIIALFAEIL